MSSSRSKSDLDHIYIKLANKILQKNDTFLSLMNIQISLLQHLNTQIDQYEQYNYCDYELSYVVYMICTSLLMSIQQVTRSKNADLYQNLKEKLDHKSRYFNIFKTKLSSSNGFQERINPVELMKLMKNNHVLLIDYRQSKDYKHAHIKFNNLVHVDPNLMKLNNVTCSEMERSLDVEQIELFKMRSMFDFIVIYDYDSYTGDKFEDILIEPRAKFNYLIDVLMNKDQGKGIKLHPMILSGGVKHWHKIFGDGSIENSTKKPVEIKENNNKKYVTKFEDYITGNGSRKPVNQSRLIETNYIKPTVQGITPFDPTPVKSKPIPKNDTSNDKSPSSSLVTSSSKAESKSPSPITKQTTISSKKSNLLQSFTTGLKNLGNSCYMNSVVQCLAASPQLTSFFFPTVTESFSTHSYKQHINPNNKLGSKGILTTSFVELLLNMFNSNGQTFSPNKFKKIMGSLSPNQQFMTFDQQDCVEFLNFLLDALHEDLNQVNLTNEEKKRITDLTPEQEKSRETLPVRLASTIEWERYLKLNFSVIVDYFQGQHLSQLKCLNCKFTSTTYNSFSILSLPIPDKLNKASEISLYDCIDEFVSTELLDDDNKWYCPNCKKFTKSTKKIAITRLPQVLIINFKRFKMDDKGNFKKLETFITYPVTTELDLTKYWPGLGTSFNGGLKMSVEEEKQLLTQFSNRNQTPPFKYKLFGVANHFGNLTTGHYTSYVHKHNSQDKPKEWCYFDDASITYNVSPSKILNKNAYCLFYQRV